MTRGESIDLYRSLNQLGNLQGVKFAYCVAKNINMLKEEMTALDKSMEFSEKYKEFDSARIDLAEKYADKDESGEAKKEKSRNGGEQFVISPVNQKKFEKDFEVLKKAHKASVLERDKQMEDYTKLLMEQSAYVPYKVKLENVPDTINAGQISGIYEIIEE